MFWRKAGAGIGLVLAALAADAQDAEPFNVKGVRFGTSETDLLAAFPAVKCAATKQAGERICMVKDTYAGGSALLFFGTRGEEGVFHIAIEIEARNYSGVVQALAERYGKPESAANSPTPRWLVGKPSILISASYVASDPTKARIYFVPFAEARGAAERARSDRQKDM